MLKGIIFFVFRKPLAMQVCSEKALAIMKKIKPPFVNIELGSTAKFNNKRMHPKMDNNSLAHTKWNCKYHIVFAPKYRRKEIYGEKKVEIGKILR